jgi:hypothetical protein
MAILLDAASFGDRCLLTNSLGISNPRPTKPTRSVAGRCRPWYHRADRFRRIKLTERIQGQATNTIDEIVEAASALDSSQFLKLRKKLDRLESMVWEAELVRVAAQMKKAKISEEEIDRRVVRRRRESRA